MSDDLDERDEHGNLTDWALACNALLDAGCDCGTDEPGTCLGCACERAMMTERSKVERMTADLARVTGQRDALVKAAKPALNQMTRHWMADCVCHDCKAWDTLAMAVAACEEP